MIWNFYKMMFLFMILMSTFIVVSANSWFTMWVGLEINMLSFIPLMNNMKNSYSAEASLKYFIVQAMASSILLMSMIFLSLDSMISSFLMFFLNSSLMLKIGIPPFHFWFPEVLEGLSWMNCLIILIWQKISPMIMISYNSSYSVYFIFIILVSMVISGIMGINQVSLRKIMAYSSMNHMSWMISALIFSPLIWMNYFIVYSLMSIMIIYIFLKINIFYLQELFLLKNNFLKILFSMNFLAMGGLPPFIGFFPKWLTIQILISNNLMFLSFFMIFFTLISLYFYIRIASSMLMINFLKKNSIEIKINYSFLYWKFLSVISMSLIFCTLTFNLC